MTDFAEYCRFLFDEGGLDEELGDLIDVVTVCVLQNKGMIYALPRDQMPTPTPQAAIFRY